MKFSGYYNTEFPRFFLLKDEVEELVNFKACPCYLLAHQRLDFHSMNFNGFSLIAPFIVASKILSRTTFVRQVMDFSKVGVHKSVFEKKRSKTFSPLVKNSKLIQAEKERILLFIQVNDKIVLSFILINFFYYRG